MQNEVLKEMNSLPCVTNKTFTEIKVDDQASLARTLTKRDIQLFAILTGDMNPAHLDEQYAKSDLFHQIVGHGMWTGSLFSTLFSMHLPGPGAIYVSQNLRFLRPVHLGDTITAIVKVIDKEETKKHIKFETLCINQKGEKIIAGEAIVIAPEEKVCWAGTPLPQIQLKGSGHSFVQWLLSKAQGLVPLKIAVVHPVDVLSISGVVEAAKANIIIPILVGPEHKIKKAAEEAHIDISQYELISTLHSHEAAARAVELVHEKRVESIMKGKLSTEELFTTIVDQAHGLRTGRRMSHVFILDVPNYPKPIFLTDTAINIKPNLMDKKDIIQNAVDLYQTLGLGIPKVAILSAVETVTEKIPSTLDATALCKMAERNQIRGAILDGPLAFDNAVSKESANIKGIVSLVAGDADILVVPDLESGNMLYKELRYFVGATEAGIVLGATVPIVLTSRAGDIENRVASCALALLYQRLQTQN